MTKLILFTLTIWPSLAMTQTISPLIEQMISQNTLSNGFTLSQVNDTNAEFRLNKQANSVRFIYRHMGETLHLFGTFFGLASEVSNTTMGQQDTGQGTSVAESKALIESGLARFQELATTMNDAFWLEETDTPFFGKVSRYRLFCHVMYHNSYHTGQISLTLSKGQAY